MVKELTDLQPYIPFINKVNSNPKFSDPMLSDEEKLKNNLFAAVDKSSNHVYGVFEDEELTGLFVFLILEDEFYIEMLVGLSDNQRAYEEMFDFLRWEHPGYNADFVYNPNNYILHGLLEKEQAEFEVEQQKLVLRAEVPYHSAYQVELYSEKYKEQYETMHSTDGYWTADKVIAAPDSFRIILAIEQEEVVGYIDITHRFEENEPYDLFVKPKYRRKGYGKAMLAKAIALNKPKGMMLLVDVDNVAAIAMYESLGFEKAVGENNMTAHLKL